MPNSLVTTIIESGMYSVDTSGSTVTFVVRSAFGLIKRTGRFRLTHGSVVAHDDPRQSGVVAQIATTSLDTGNARRDRRLKSAAFLETDVYPHIHFIADSVSMDGPDTSLQGRLTVRGAEHKVSVAIRSVETTGERHYRVLGYTTIDRHELGVSKFRHVIAGRVQVIATVDLWR